jgi:hypothetical protein
LAIDFDMNRRSFCGNLDTPTLDDCEVKKPAATGLNFILRMGWVGERHISTPWGDPDGLRRANVGTADAKVFDSAIEAIAGTLKLFRPLHAEGISVGSPEIDAPALKIVEEAQATKLSRPPSKSSRRQRAMARLKEDLGQELTNRAIDRIHEHRGVPGMPAKGGS